MKRVLITGANSYVGTNVEKWLMKEPDIFHVETLDMRNSNWSDFDFSIFDVVFHVAGIAHVSTKKKMKDLYFKVNSALAIETAQKAKASGVKQFIFMSSMIVYSSKETRITKETIPNPDNFYGESKLQAEQGIQKLQDKSFNVCILRPPMIYGPNSKGNFPKLLEYSKKTFIFPIINNYRSILYIDNLCNFVMNMIENNEKAVFFPQNQELVTVTDIIRFYSKIYKKKIYFTRILGIILNFLTVSSKYLHKIFSEHYYTLEMSEYITDYRVISCEESFKITGETK